MSTATPNAHNRAPTTVASGPGPVLALVLGFLGLSVLVHGVALYHVLATDADMVRSDYYEAGERHDVTMAEAREAALRDAEVRLIDGAIVATMARRAADAQGLVATVTLTRPGDRSLDQTLRLPLVAATRPRATGPEGKTTLANSRTWTTRQPVSALAPGRWLLRLEVASTPRLSLDRVLHLDRAGQAAP